MSKRDGKDSVSVNRIETAALGRSFQLGMLYDCRRDELITGFRLWNQEQLQQNIISRSHINTDFNISTSDSIQDKSKLLNIDGGLKLSLLGDLISVSGAAKYLNDTKRSFIQQRLTLHYHSTSEFKELIVNQLPFENIIDNDTATHVVSGIQYGADACFVFDREVSSDEDKKNIEIELKLALEKLQGIGSVDANADLTMTEKQETAIKKFTCTFYGDFQLQSNPTSFKDAMKVFADLPKLLGEKQELAVPLRVWLYPLDKLNSKASKILKDISMNLIQETESVIESLNTAEMKCSDLLKDSPALMFAEFHEKIQQMKQNCNKYKLSLMKKLGSLLPNIRGDVMKETALIDLLQEHEESPFRGSDLEGWLKERKRESEIIKTVLRQLEDVKVEVNTYAIMMDLGVGNLVSYTFTSLNCSDMLLFNQKAYLSNPTKKETEEKCPDIKKKSWLTAEVYKTMRSNLEIFKILTDSQGSKPAKFIVSSKEMENHPGSCILLYEHDCDEAVFFTPPSKPACSITEEVKGQSVVLKVHPPCPATVELRLLYKLKQDSVWTSELVTKDQDTVTLTDLRQGAEYEIKCAALGKLTYTIDSDVIRVTTQRENKDIGRTEKIQHLFHRYLPISHHNKLRAADVLLISAQSLQSHESCAEEELIQTFLQKLLMMNYRARYIKSKETNEEAHTQQRDIDSFEDEGDIFDDILENISLLNKGTSQFDLIHPMDVQMVVFHCADGFLKQLMVTKLSQCQYALPLLVPDPFTRQIEFPLWTFRQIHKSWKIRNTCNEIISKTQPIYKAETPMVFFFRFGTVPSTKTQLINSLINERHNTFFHRNCPGSRRSRVLMDGVVEITWFCPSGSYDDKFTDCVAFCNLHGDAGDHEKQLQILTEMASVNVVLLQQLQRDDRSATIIQKLYSEKNPLICLLTEDESTVTEIKKGKFKIGLKYRSQSDVSEELRRAIDVYLSESSHTFRLEDVSKHSDIRVDEEDDEDCRRGRAAAQQMMSLLEKKDLREIKESFLPHQGRLWHQWSQNDKELHRPRGDEMDIRRKQTEMKKIREQQHELNISDFMKLFIKQINLHTEYKMFFLKWLRILLDEYTSADLSYLLDKYHEKWSAVVKLREDHAKSEKLTAEQTELERISGDLQAAAFGVEHIMREIGQIYESCSSVNKNKKDLQIHFSSLPSLAAEMMISGFPLELMDGDAAHVPVIWISAVLDQLIQKLGDQRVFVLSVLGLQSSGKSTMLNAMFGLQFAVSAGRCTRGAFMQLVRVSDEMKTQINFDYILVVDTEGLRALELAGRSTRHHDNELATFVVGLGNLTLINIFGENPCEMEDFLQIVIQAFMRMKKVRLNPSCVFVLQNISDVTARDKNMEGRRRLQEKLDAMTKLAAEDEDCDVELFSDVIRFDVQNDVKYVAQFWEGSPPMAPPNPNYCENIQELKENIMYRASKSHRMMLTHVKDRVKDLWEALLNEQFVFSFRNSLEISAYQKLETEYSKWTWSLRSAMMETENKLHNQIENESIHEVDETDLQRELKKTSDEVEKSISELFEKDRDKDILIQWKTSFEIKIKELQKNIVRETKRKLNEILQQRDLKKRIDVQRTQHENTLYEKSKELALKLKDKANDEETLKKEFDLFWKECVKNKRDTSAIRDIDILRDVRGILSGIYKNAHVEDLRKNGNIFIVQGYSDYVQLKKSSGFTGHVTNTFRSAKEKFGYGPLSKEDEIQIKSLVTDVVQQTDRMIQSFNISKMGYNISCIQQLTDYIKTSIKEHQEGAVKYVFKKEFFVDLALSICKGSNKMITDQYRLFREANDPEIYVEKRRKECYIIFQKYCHGSPSAAVFGQIVCEKLKEPIEQSVYKKTARDLTDEVRSNCPSLNKNRSNLEKYILKRLAEEENFDKYMNYIHNPRDHFKSFIRDEVSRYITDQFSLSVLPKMKENIKLLQQKIMRAAHQSTEHVQVNSGDVGLWLKSFTQQLSGVLNFSEKDLSGVKHDDVNDFNLLEEVIRQELPDIMSEISRRFNRKSFDEKMDYKFRPDELLIDHLCQCCWVQCPFCKATCTKTVENHDEDHSVAFHRVTGINGTCYHRSTQNLFADICTDLVANNLNFNTLHGRFKYREYRRARGVYADWTITPDLSELPYWKWFVYRFQKDLEKSYMKTFAGKGKIPDEWRKYSKLDAIDCLDKYL